MKAATCPRCKGIAKPTKVDEFSHCPCGSVFIVLREDGFHTAGGPDGWRLVDEDE